MSPAHANIERVLLGLPESPCCSVCQEAVLAPSHAATLASVHLHTSSSV